MPKVVLPLTLSIALTLAGAAFSPALADTITLKSGEEYEGTVLRQNDAEVVLLVKVSEGITDEQTFKKEDIRAVVTTPADLLEYEKLARYGVGPHSQTPAAYNLGIAAYENFLKRFPDSGHQQQVKNQIKLLKEERARVARKEVKISERWYTAAEIKEEQYQINAQRLLQVMNDQAQRGDLVGALNTFDKIESDFPGSSAYPQAIPTALVLIKRLKAEIVRAVPIAKQQQQKFEEGIQHTQEPEKSRMLAAHESNKTRAEQALQQSTAKWKPFFAAMDQSVAALTQTIETESTRLATIDPDPMTRSLQLTEESRTALTAGDAGTAASKLAEASTLWQANEAATRLKASVETLQKRLAAEKEEAAKAEKAEAEKGATKDAAKDKGTKGAVKSASQEG